MRWYSPSLSQRASVSGSRLGRSPRIGKSVAGRCRVALYWLESLLVTAGAHAMARCRAVLMFQEDGTRLLGIVVHLRRQRRQIREFHFVTQLGDELDFDAAAIQLLVEVEQMGFEQRLHAGHGRPRTQARHRRPRMIGDAVHPGGVDARKRRGLAGEAQVGGGKSERPAEFLAGNDMPVDRVGPAEETRGGHEITRHQRFADAGTRHTFAFHHYRLDLAGHEALRVAQALEQCDVARTPFAETELRADPDFARGQPTDQHLGHELLGAEVAEAPIEAQQADLVGAEREQARGLGMRQQQARRRRGRRKELARQRLETQHHRRHADHARTRGRVAHQRLMPEVKAVESADADHTAVRAPGSAFDVTKQPAHQFWMGPAGANRPRQGWRQGSWSIAVVPTLNAAGGAAAGPSPAARRHKPHRPPTPPRAARSIATTSAIWPTRRPSPGSPARRRSWQTAPARSLPATVPSPVRADTAPAGAGSATAGRR